MFEFLNDLTPMTKGILAATAAAGVATMVSRHFDKKEFAEACAAADEEAATNPTAVVDPTVPMDPPAQPAV